MIDIVPSWEKQKENCGNKRSFRSRKLAKKAIMGPKTEIQIYRCPVCDLFHHTRRKKEGTT